jgi:hypothetical protein
LIEVIPEGDEGYTYYPALLREKNGCGIPYEVLTFNKGQRSDTKKTGRVTAGPFEKS